MKTLIISVLSPIFGIIAMGYSLKRMHFGDENFWRTLDKFIYYIFMPSLLLHKLASANFDKVENAINMVKVVGISLFIVMLFLTIFQFFKKFNPKSYTSIFQGSIRYNTYIFLGIIDALYSDEGMVLAIFLITFLIPFINFFCVSVFGIYVNDGKFSIKKFIKSLATNPLLLSTLLGAYLNFSGIGLFVFEDLIKVIGMPAITLGLLSVGYGLKIRELGSFKLEFWISIFAKLILLPSVVFVVSYVVGLTGMPFGIVLLFSTMPTAVSSYMLARELGGDLGLMSSLITAQALFSFFTITYIISYCL